MSSVFSIFCGTTFSPIFHFFKEQYQCLQELTKHYSNATVEEKFNRYPSFQMVINEIFLLTFQELGVQKEAYSNKALSIG
jgi:hypothetical protein